MGYRVDFLDNTAVTAEYLNSAAEDLGGGVLAFADDMVYGVDDLNGIAGALIEKGVSRGCGLSVSGENVTIAEGVLFMPDGRKVVIDTGGVTLSFAAGTVHYVWFYKDALTGFVAPRCTIEAPSGEYVLLGRVSAEGTIEGRPERAVMKNPYLGLHGTESFTESYVWDGATEETLLWEYELQDVGYRHITVYSTGYTSNSLTKDAFCGFVNTETGAAFTVMQNVHSYAERYEVGYSYASDNGELFIGLSGLSGDNNYYGIYLRFDMGTDDVLRVYQRAARTTTGSTGNNKPVEIIMTLS